MPTISINCQDFEELLSRSTKRQSSVSVEQIEAWLPLVKGELKDQDPVTGELRIELQDSNRPDLWSCEGIVRQIRIHLNGKATPYKFFSKSKKPTAVLHVSRELKNVRPYVAACTAVGHPVSEEGLVQLIQMQEKLADIYGRKRKTVSIGLYRLQKIEFPVQYELVRPEAEQFTPLGFDQKMALNEILTVHPKGLEYGEILAGHDKLPILRDSQGHILSLPPIINSREVGEVRVGDQDVFVEVTGTDLPMVLLTLNIVASNLADRGAEIGSVTIQYPYQTRFGKTIQTPYDFSTSKTIPIQPIELAIGENLGMKEIRHALVSYGYEVKGVSETLDVKLPPYRNDLMHTVDVLEDVAISRGYDSFTPVMPSQFTVGSLSRIEQMSDRTRDLMIGLGFQEIFSNILGSREELCDRMRISDTTWDAVVEIENVMSLTFGCLRQWMIPSLLRVESASTRSFYPHKLFEVGEVARPDPSDEHGARTAMMVGAMIAHAEANFSEIHSCLDLILYYLNIPYHLEPLDHPSFLVGRSGAIIIEDQPLGLIGELHPEVLERWQVRMPTSVFELEIGKILKS